MKKIFKMKGLVTITERASKVLSQWWAAQPPNLRGAAWQVLSNLCFALMAVGIKIAGETIESFEIVFFRCLFGLILTLPFILGQGRGAFRIHRPELHLLRALTGIAALSCGVYAITHLPLAQALTLGFTKTFFILPLAVLVLGETVPRWRWAATALGFVGVLIILRPDAAGAVDPAALVALLGAALVAGVVILLRILARSERIPTILFYNGVLTTLVSAVPAYLVWRMPDGETLILLFGIAVCGVSGQATNIRSYRDGEAAAMAPFGYLRLILAGFLGFVLFGEIPDSWTWAGAAVIVASTLYIALREARSGRKTQL